MTSCVLVFWPCYELVIVLQQADFQEVVIATAIMDAKQTKYKGMMQGT